MRNDLPRRGEGANAEAERLQRLAPTFFAIHQREYTKWNSAYALHRLDRARRRSAGSDDVFHDHNTIAAGERAFHLLSGAVRLGFLRTVKALRGRSESALVWQIA